MKKSELRQIIREEVQRLKEGSIGVMDGDQSDVFSALVRRNKNKSAKQIAKIAKKDDFFEEIDIRDLENYAEEMKNFFDVVG